MSRKFLILFVLLIFIVGFLASREAIQERGVKPVVEKKKEENKNQKIALVIGNASYKESPLKNPANDANDIAEVLKKCGFEVALKTNTNQLDMEKAVREFSDNLKDGGIGLFYFSGHGVQVEGINYLIPVNSNIQDEIDIKAKSVSANYILGKMDRRKDGMNIIILDACRINPYARSFRSPSTGLAQMDAPQGSLIVYATSPGKTADDGTGRNGIFTKHLLEMIKETPFEIMVLLRKVRKNVMDETNEKQIPWESSSLLGSFYFSYTDTQLEKVRAENSELQSKIKVLDLQIQEFEKMNLEKEIREAANKREDLKILSKAKQLEEERLLKDKENQERLEQEEKRLAQEEEEKREERKRQRANEEELSKKLQEKFAEKQEKLDDIKKEVMPIEVVRKEVQSLEAKIIDATSLITPIKESAIKQLKMHYDILLKKLKNKPISPKDQFETDEDYEARVKKSQEKIRILEEKYETENQDIENKFENEIAIVTKAHRDRIEELTSKKYPVEGLKVELFKYYAEKGLYRVILMDTKGYLWFYSLMVKSEIARRLFERKESLKAEGYYYSIYNTTSLREASIIDQIEERRYQLVSGIRLRSNYITLSETDVISMLKQKGFIESKKNPSGKFIHEYELVKIKEDKVILDYATGLMWHPSGSNISINIVFSPSSRKAKNWLNKLNMKGYAGFHDWRYPTVEEAASLLEKFKWEGPPSLSSKYTKDGYIYVNPIFPLKQKVIWTGDKESSDNNWVVNLYSGEIFPVEFKKSPFIIDIRPVRSMQ